MAGGGSCALGVNQIWEMSVVGEGKGWKLGVVHVYIAADAVQRAMRLSSGGDLKVVCGVSARACVYVESVYVCGVKGCKLRLSVGMSVVDK